MFSGFGAVSELTIMFPYKLLHQEDHRVISPSLQRHTQRCSGLSRCTCLVWSKEQIFLNNFFLDFFSYHYPRYRLGFGEK